MPRVYGAPTFDPFVDQGHIHAQRAIHHLRMPNDRYQPRPKAVG
jgi:hypothetical protein